TSNMSKPRRAWFPRYSLANNRTVDTNPSAQVAGPNNPQPRVLLIPSFASHHESGSDNGTTDIEANSCDLHVKQKRVNTYLGCRKSADSLYFALFHGSRLG
ncbi:hypothetical protein CIHG_08743, partial [Coccidioides immitis H538.4]